MTSRRFVRHDVRLAVCRLDAAAEVPPWAWTGPFVAVTRTPDELSIVCAEDAVPEAVRHESGWGALKIVGPFPFETVGVLSSIAEPLALAGISIFAVSTFDTDWLLVKAVDLDRAAAVLRAAGHEEA